MREYNVSAGEVLLACENVKKVYGDFVLDCSVALKKGCVTGLIGKNGAGKTTLFKTLLGIVRADGGQIFWEGKQVDCLDKGLRDQIGVVLSDSFFSGFLYVSDLAAILEQMYPSFDKKEFLGMCAKHSIPLKKAVKDFSTGMKAKLKVLTALSHKTKMLILDEPTSGLDVIARDEILQLLREYMEEEGRVILISSHISTDLEGLCDDIYMIDGGEIVLHEDTDVLLGEYGVLKVTEEQLKTMDRSYLLKIKEEPFGYQALTDQKRFYQENYPQMAVEKGSIDNVILLMVSGKDIDMNL